MEARTSSTNEQLVRQFIDAENSHNVDRILALLTDDVVFEDVAFGILMKGKDQVRQTYGQLFASTPDYKSEALSIVTSEKSFAMEYTTTGTQKGELPGIPATGKRISVRGCHIGEFDNGKIKSRRDYWDLAGLKKQLGIAT